MVSIQWIQFLIHKSEFSVYIRAFSVSLPAEGPKRDHVCNRLSDDSDMA